MTPPVTSHAIKDTLSPDSTTSSVFLIIQYNNLEHTVLMVTNMDPDVHGPNRVNCSGTLLFLLPVVLPEGSHLWLCPTPPLQIVNGLAPNVQSPDVCDKLPTWCRYFTFRLFVFSHFSMRTCKPAEISVLVLLLFLCAVYADAASRSCRHGCSLVLASAS